MFLVGLFFEASSVDVFSWSFFRAQLMFQVGLFFEASSVDVFSWSFFRGQAN